jgi:hexosaminidase
LWGSLSNISGTASPAAENLQMSIWSTVWADPREMYEQGYSLINMQNNHLYIIPGGGYDYLDLDDLKDEWEPNRFYDYNELEVIPSYSPQMLGAAYMIWNDNSREQGIGEEEMYERFVQPLEVIAGKLWE